MGTFVITTVIILIMILSKYFFFHIEPQYSMSLWGKLDLLGLIILFLAGIRDFVKNIAGIKKKKSTDKKQKVKLSAILFFLAAIGVVVTTFYLNSKKVSVHWDAVALYDARAKFLAGGMKFSEMPTLSRFDNQNKYYYLLYPPYTSIGHFFWREIPFLSNIPVSVYYSIALLLLVSILFFASKSELGIKGAGLLALLVASNGSIINVTILEYTNLPYIVHIVGGALLISSYLKSEKKWELYYGILLISTSIWIRLLEPMWIGVLISLGLVIFSMRNPFKKLSPLILLGIFCLIQYFSWSYFTKFIGHNPEAIHISKIGMIEPFVGLFTGALFPVISVVVKAWGTSLFVHLTLILALVLRWKYVLKKKELLFLGTVVFLSIFIYFAEFYILSFQVDWWSVISKSLDRSASFLIPISGYLLIRLIISSKPFMYLVRGSKKMFGKVTDTFLM